jgi:hypothetical protein
MCSTRLPKPVGDVVDMYYVAAYACVVVVVVVSLDPLVGFESLPTQPYGCWGMHAHSNSGVHTYGAPLHVLQRPVGRPMGRLSECHQWVHGNAWGLCIFRHFVAHVLPAQRMHTIHTSDVAVLVSHLLCLLTLLMLIFMDAITSCASLVPLPNQ